jgi:hypothetical protein
VANGTTKPGDGNQPINRAVTFAAAVAGLVAYLYFLGGVVTWLRMSASRLSGDDAVVAVHNSRLLSIGARVAAFELALLATVSLIVVFIVLRNPTDASTTPRIGGFDNVSGWSHVKEGWRDLWTLSGMIGPATAALLVVLGLALEPDCLRVALLVAGGLLGAAAAFVMMHHRPPPDRSWRRAVTRLGTWIREDTKPGVGGVRALARLLLVLNAFVAIYLVPALQGTILLAATAVIYAGPFLGWPNPGAQPHLASKVVRSTGVWVGIAASTVVAAAWVATPPIAFSRAAFQQSSEPVVAGYIGRDGDGLIVATCSPNPAARRSDGSLIRFFSKDDVTELSIGGEKYRFDTGGRPSLWQLAFAAVSDRDPSTENAVLHHALRGRAEHLCDDTAA